MTSHKAKWVLSNDTYSSERLKAKHYRSFFKKWLELERRIGDEEGADIVKQKAIEWTQRAASNE